MNMEMLEEDDFNQEEFHEELTVESDVNWETTKDEKVHAEISRGATTGKAPKAWALPRFWVSICSYKKQPVKKIWGRILVLAWLKFAVAPLHITM